MACKPTLRTRARWRAGLTGRGPTRCTLGLARTRRARCERRRPAATSPQTAADLAWLQMPPRAPTIMLCATPITRPEQTASTEGLRRKSPWAAGPYPNLASPPKHQPASHGNPGCAAATRPRNELTLYFRIQSKINTNAWNRMSDALMWMRPAQCAPEANQGRAWHVRQARGVAGSASGVGEVVFGCRSDRQCYQYCF